MDADNLQHCDARAIAPYVHALTEQEHLDVVDLLEGLGGLSKGHAEQLRALIREARKVQDIDAWLKEKCGG
jgi:hypothetical protein